MKKLTIEELKEYIKQGKYFKIEVTPEESKLVQEAAFDCRRYWVNGANIPCHTNEPFLYVEARIVFGNDDGVFCSSGLHEIGLVTSPKLDTQVDRWRFLLDGGKLICDKYPSNGYYFIQEGEVRCSTGSKSGVLFTDDEWIEYKEPKQWYEDIPEEGILCWVDDDRVYDNRVSIRDHVTLVVRYEDGVLAPYHTMTDEWIHATPVTLEEAEKLIHKGN